MGAHLWVHPSISIIGNSVAIVLVNVHRGGNAKFRVKFPESSARMAALPVLSDKLKKELIRVGQPAASPKEIKQEFNARYLACKIAPQTLRKGRSRILIHIVIHIFFRTGQPEGNF